MSTNEILVKFHDYNCIVSYDSLNVPNFFKTQKIKHNIRNCICKNINTFTK